MDFVTVLYLTSLYCGFIGASGTPGEVLDSTLKRIELKVSALVSSDQLVLQKLQQIEKSIELLKTYHPCYPCKKLQGSELHCDCRYLKGKQDCLEFYDAGVRVNGLYTLKGGHINTTTAYCDQTTQGGGWTVIMRRKDGSVGFYRYWEDYKMGFGDSTGEFWFGNENIHDLTKSYQGPLSSQLLINMNIKGQMKPIWAKYESFKIGDESNEYILFLSRFSGNTTDAMSSYSGNTFSTLDHKGNGLVPHRCPATLSGGWWFENCFQISLTGTYESKNNFQYEIWWEQNKTQPEFVEMKVRRNKR